MTNPSSSTRKSSLTCYQTLLPPLKQLGGTGRAKDSSAVGSSNNTGVLYRDQQPAWQCSFSRDGTWLAIAYGSPEPCVRIWKHTPHDENEPSKNEMTQIAATGGATNDEWNLHATLSGIQVRTIRSVAFAPVMNPVVLASASFDGTICVWELVQDTKNPTSETSSSWWDCMAQLEGHDNEVKCVAWNSTGTALATCGRDKSVWVWESFLPGTIGSGGTGDGDFECLAILNGHNGDVKCVQFALSHGVIGDGDEILLSSSYDDTIRIWAEDAGDWYQAACLDASASTIWSMAVSPSSTRLISGSHDGSLTIYKFYTSPPADAEDKSPGWKCVGKLDKAHASEVFSVSYASARCGHARIATGGADNRIQIYREACESVSDRPLFELDASIVSPQGDVNCVTWHPWDGSILASAGDDGTVRLWRYNTTTPSSG